MTTQRGERIRVQGIVQGVGFRPTVWHLANALNLVGEVSNDAEGVLIQVWGTQASIDRFIQRLTEQAPPLSKIRKIERQILTSAPTCQEFSITTSRQGRVQTGIAPDAATCGACRAESLSPGDRRYRYPFTNCTHCGPRLSIVRAIPYDRATTSMAKFTQCPECQNEYDDPGNRRFHAQPNACGICGPRVWLEDATGKHQISSDHGKDYLHQVAELLNDAKIVAIKGIGGIHLACDATNPEVVARLRARKRRYHKAFAIMARDVDMVRRFATASEDEVRMLTSSAAPIVVLPIAGESLASGIAPGQNSLGFMLPYTPLHHLLMSALEIPIVLTSGNRSDEPQVIDNVEAKDRLTGIADYWLLHDREIVNRLDDSVIKFMAGGPRLLRRARGYAPAPLELPVGFEKCPEILAMGAELKNTFCMLRNGQAIISQHMGDLENAATHQDYRNNLSLYQQLFQHQPKRLVVDLHPDYLSTQWGRQLASEQDIPLEVVQHHHAHIAGCMADQGIGLDAGPVLGIALDGLGMGEEGALWGGEFLKVEYADFERLGYFQPVEMLGGAKAMYEPWRNTYAHLRQHFSREQLLGDYADLDLIRFLKQKPLSNLDQMMARGLNCPKASSCGRLFDAVAAALGICSETAGYEGQAAIEMESLVESSFESLQLEAYPYTIEDRQGLQVITWRPLWVALLGDLSHGVAAHVMAARFHLSVAKAVTEVGASLCEQHGLGQVALSGGVFQNRLLLEAAIRGFEQRGLLVLSPVKTPANDGGISLGQAVIAAARMLKGTA